MGAEACDARPLIFAPEGARPIFFLHIPKTSGSSTNAFLRALYGKGAVVEHVEYQLPDLLAGRRVAIRAPCVSGHVPLWAWRLYRGAEHYACVTILRDPWARLVSHVNWVAKYAAGAKLPPGAGGVALGRVAALVEATDFESVAGLRKLMIAVKAEPNFASFDNYQVRMLRAWRMDAMEGRLGDADLSVAEAELASFLHVGFCEDQAAFQADLMSKLGKRAEVTPIRANRASVHRLRADNLLAREVFAPWLELDQGLYGFARGRFRRDGAPAAG